MVSRRIVVSFSVVCVSVGLAAVVVRFVTQGGGAYGDAFLPLGLLAAVFMAWSLIALSQYVRRETRGLHPVAASVLASVVLLVLALAIGLRG